MGSVKDTYDILADFWDRIQGGKTSARKSLAVDLNAIASLLRSACKQFEAGKVPTAEGHELAVTINLADKLAAMFKDEYRGLAEVFDQTLPEIGRLMRDADFFIDEKPRYSVHHQVGAPSWNLADQKIKDACYCMTCAAAVISAYAREFEKP